MEGNTKFPTELVDEHANAGKEDKRRSQIKTKENMDEVGESLCIVVTETMNVYCQAEGKRTYERREPAE